MTHPNEAAAEQLDALTLEYAEKNNVDRPTARVAVLKTASGRRLYAESIGRAAPSDPNPQLTALGKRLDEHIAAREAMDPDLARTKQRELEAYAKARGMRLADAVQTPEGRKLYNEQVRASRGGV